MRHIFFTRPEAGINKTTPYINAYKEGERNNPLKPHLNSGNTIQYKRLAAQVVHDALLNKEGKINYEHFHTEDNIRKHLAFNTAQSSDHMISVGKKSLVCGNQFSEYIKTQFDTMTHTGENINAFLITTHNYIFAMILRIKDSKEKLGNKTYVIKVYDPHLTDKTARIECKTAADLEKHRFTDFIYHQWIDKYFRNNSKHIVAITKVSQALLDNKAAKPDLTLSDTTNNTLLEPISCHYLFSQNIADGLTKLADQIANANPPLDKSFLKELLAAKDPKGCPGFMKAVENNCLEAIETFDSLLEFMPEEERAELLTAKNQNGAPALLLALKYNSHKTTILALGRLIIKKLASPKKQVELLAAKDQYGIPGLLMALTNDHTEAIEAYKELIASLSKTQQAELFKVLEKANNQFHTLLPKVADGSYRKLLEYIFPNAQPSRPIDLSKAQQAELSQVVDEAIGLQQLISSEAQLPPPIDLSEAQQAELSQVVDEAIGLQQLISSEAQLPRPIDLSEAQQAELSEIVDEAIGLQQLISSEAQLPPPVDLSEAQQAELSEIVDEAIDLQKLIFSEAQLPQPIDLSEAQQAELSEIVDEAIDLQKLISSEAKLSRSIDLIDGDSTPPSKKQRR